MKTICVCALLAWLAVAPSTSASDSTKDATSACGGASYCADSSREPRSQTPMAPPRRNQVFHDPEFGSRMIRVTDETGVDGKLAGLSYNSNSSAEINEWGKLDPSLGKSGGYYFYVMTSGGGAVPFSMDASTMQVTARCGSLPMCRLPSGGSFSYVDPSVLYGTFGNSGVVSAYNIANGKQSSVYDFNRCPGLPASLTGYPGSVSNSGDDTKFANYPGGKMQGFTRMVTFYDRTTSRCYWYDTEAGKLGGSDMQTVAIQTGVLAPPPAPKVTVTSGSLPAGDYYVQLTLSTLCHPDLGETLPSPETHVHLNAPGGIAIAAPEFENPYGAVIKGYSAYIGTAPGEETKQASLDSVQQPYTQSSALAKGASPPKSSTAGYNVHNARISRDGKTVKVVPQNGGSVYLWWPGTTRISACASHGQSKSSDVASYCGGHTVFGYSHMINAGGPGGNSSLLLRPNDDLTRITQLIPSEAAATGDKAVPADKTLPGGMDSHWSWNNTNPSDTAPVCGAYSRSSFHLQGDGSREVTKNPVLAMRQPWDREIVCVATSGPPRVWRFAHHRATGTCNANAKDGSCFNAIAIGNVSQDGKFFLFSSDWEWSLGSDPHAPGCPNSGRCRVDVFIVELK